ncbi:FxSxx-COOH system tetratricopeptide repeat protein [Streptomyces sp. NBC_01373]|uniref:FxSxx-COOH system tetratricopeptide repeat protein n=1 Tax=Streptomyces sp. NBC_01373 TaxID=2903843 RepID=UPI002251EB27|nr:FxSxx-COOH system tetratricopeptide repeat protein [Streptomyces sp. NBC_01373]MCX4703735.1 FxSxx-COOH system tetratricopeptide repeat protein [Streptomyces sp. NBC_01373]
MWRTLASAVAGLLVLFVGSLAFNAASGQSRWPGPLDYVRVHPWVVLLILIPISLIGVWQVPRRDRAQDRLAPPAYRLPPRNTNFTGRDATLREVRQCLTSRNGVAMVAVQGLGGVGKTQLAIEYAYRYLSKYRFVAFVGAEDSDLVASHFVSLAGQLGLTEVSSDQAIPRVYGKLLDHRPWLIIFDNGEKPGTLTHALPSGGLASNGHVIVTTRVSGWSGRAGVIDLDVFTRQESVKLLVRRVPGMTEAVADRIAEQLGDLPLALEQAAGYMGYNHTAPEEYLTLLTSRLEEMIARGELTDRPEAEEVVVASLWSLSVERLNTDQPQAVRLLELCALLAPEPIPLDLFTGSPETLNGAAADALVWDTTVGALAGLGLARRENASLVLHRLVQAAIRAPMPDEVRTDARVQLCRALLAAVPHDIHGDPDARPRWQELLPHVIAVTKDDPPAECAAETAVLLRLASEFLIQIGDCSVALPLCERALAIDESIEGRDAEAGFDLITLAQIHKDLNAPETARPLAERALRLHESCLPADSPAIATDLATLARLLCILGEHRAAQPLAERALQIDETAYGPDDPFVSFDLIALANVHVDLGDYATAAPLISRALQIREARYAPDHLYIGYVLLFKARVVHRLNDPSAADLARRGAQILHTRLGKTHPKTVDAFALVNGLR